MTKTCSSVRQGLYASLALLLTLCSFEAGAAVRTFFITGTLSNAGLDAPLVVGTPFTGTYTIDDMVVDTDPGDPNVGVYATGMFFIDFGPAIGTLTFDQGGSTRVVNDVLGPIGPAFTLDQFTISASAGARNTPGFSNPIGGASLFFRDSENGFPSVPLPAALTDDTLTGVPQVAGSPPWDTFGAGFDQFVSWQMPAAGDPNPVGCGPFSTQCFVNLQIATVNEAFPLTVNKTGSGSGTVTSNPAGINCEPTCNANLGGAVILTVTPAAGSVFTGWTGCDIVNGNVCTVNMTSARTVSANCDLALQPPLPGAQGVSDIPTLNIWGLLAMIGLLGAFLGWHRRKH